MAAAAMTPRLSATFFMPRSFPGVSFIRGPPANGDKPALYSSGLAGNREIETGFRRAKPTALGFDWAAACSGFRLGLLQWMRRGSGAVAASHVFALEAIDFGAQP